ncbi:MAG: Mrp/NBP35 family ATP-binding protein [Candidatus Cloacimonetes bacterium]|nr:Mrp/NBP35 family ATP-binding protein [Candidatus Cloacimonadota bacterium]
MESAAEKIRQEKLIQENLDRIKHKIVVLSGKGGVGKSTISVNLAHGLALQGFKVGMLDVDIHGPSIAKMLGIEGQTLMVASEKDRPHPIRVHENLYALSIATLMPDPDKPIVWRGPLKMGVIKQFLQDIEWPELDYLIVDNPPGTGDEPLSAIQLLKNISGSVIVSTPQDVAFLDARKTIKFSQQMNVPILGLVENMSGFICPNCGERHEIFKGNGAEKAANDFGLDILGRIPIDPNIVVSGDSGKSFVADYADSVPAQEFDKIVKAVINKTEEK